MPTLEQLKISGRAIGHYVEQPGVLYPVEKAAYTLGAVGLAGIGITDTFKAKAGEERRKTMLNRALVLGSTAAVTFLTAHTLKWMRPVDLKEFAESVVRPLKEHAPELKKKYPDIAHLLEKLEDSADKTIEQGSKVRAKLSVAEFKELVSGFKKHGKEGLEDLNKILAVDEEGSGHFLKDVWDDLKTAISFFGVGLTACIGGLGGGILANKLNKQSSPEKTANMVKEGIFQFIANIALCAVGAGIAMSALNVPAIRKSLAKLGPAGKGLRIAGIGTGLSLGIFGGGVIANKLGQNVINPALDRMQGKTPQPVNKNEGKRKIEFWDAILHLDDLPTALALAGVAIVEPFIPLFFAFSGYRTGIGYRNDGHSHGHGHHHHGKEEMQHSYQAIPPAPPSLVNLVFQPTSRTDQTSLITNMQPTSTILPLSNTLPNNVSIQNTESDTQHASLPYNAFMVRRFA